MTFELIQTIINKDEGRSAQLVAEMLQTKLHEALESRRQEVASKIYEKVGDWEPEDEPRKPTPKEIETDRILKTKAQKNREALQKISDAFAKKKVDEEVNLEGFETEDLIDFTMTEEFAQLDELSKATLGSYIKKASQHRVRLAGAERDLDDKDTMLQRAKHGADDATYDALSKAQDTMRKQRYKVSDKSQQRAQGISTAVKKLTRD